MTTNSDQNTSESRPATDHAPITGEDRYKLAVERATAADIWRSHVESSALINRQRAQELEHEADRLRRCMDQQNHRLDQSMAQINQLHAQLLEHQSIGSAIIERLRRSPLRSVLRRVKQGYLSLRGSAEKIDPETQPDPLEAVETEAAKHAFTFRQDTELNRTLPTLLFITAPTADTALGHFALNLSGALAPYANVLVWHLSDDGPLLHEFEQTATGLIADARSRDSYDIAYEVLGDLCDQVNTIDSAIVIGPECKFTLPALAGNYVPALTILSDRHVYRHSAPFLQEILFWSTHTVFTTAQALQQTRDICRNINAGHISVLAAGSFYSGGEQSHKHAEALLNYRLHKPADGPADGYVAGWGAADYHSGLDIFVSCADAIRRKAPDKHYQFVWFAPPHDHAQDTAYPLAIQQQIQNAELADHVVVIYEKAPEAAGLLLADIALFPARSDVSGHRTIDALAQGTPVVAFEQATILAQTMKEKGFGPDCLARYGDVNDLAEKALALLQDKARQDDLAQRLKAADWNAATLDRDAQAIMARCNTMKKQIAQERRDETTIQASGRLQSGYIGKIIYVVGRQDCSDARLYVKSWKAGIGTRKPHPGLHPGIYADVRMTTARTENPFAAYLQDGRPDGPWHYPIIVPDTSPSLTELGALPVALHIHAYYPDMLADIMHRIRKNATRPDLFVSVRDAFAKAQVLKTLEDYDGKVIAVDIVPNRGRDIGPFLMTFGATLTRDYELIGHIHTKHSGHADRSVVDVWRNFLMENLLSGDNSGPMMDTILSQMTRNPAWGIVFPDDPAVLGWDDNRRSAELLAQKMKLGPLPDQFNFPAGTMFWIRSRALQPFVNLNLKFDDYPSEPLPIDGSLLHSLERLFGVIPRAMGMECALTSVPGVTR